MVEILSARRERERMKKRGREGEREVMCFSGDSRNCSPLSSSPCCALWQNVENRTSPGNLPITSPIVFYTRARTCTCTSHSFRNNRICMCESLGGTCLLGELIWSPFSPYRSPGSLLSFTFMLSMKTALSLSYLSPCTLSLLFTPFPFQSPFSLRVA